MDQMVRSKSEQAKRQKVLLTIFFLSMKSSQLTNIPKDCCSFLNRAIRRFVMDRMTH